MGRTDRPRACILARDVNIRVLPGFSCGDLVAVVVKYIEDGAERWLVGWLVLLICHMIVRILPPPVKGI